MDHIVGAVVADDVRGEPIGTARHHVYAMENVERLSGLVLIDAYGFRRERELFAQERLAHLRDGGRGFLADRRIDRRGRFRWLASTLVVEFWIGPQLGLRCS
jgi:hypothetical protein